MTTIDVELKHGFKYHVGGGEEDAIFVRISAYSMRQMEQVAPVKEIVMRAFARLAEKTDLSEAESKASKGDAESMDGSQMLTILAMYCDPGDLGKFYAHMSKLLTSGVAYINGSNEKLSGTYINDLNPSDFENLCGQYVGNFIT